MENQQPPHLQLLWLEGNREKSNQNIDTLNCE